MNKTDIFETFSVPKAVAHLAIPTMFSMIVVILYNITDAYFIGQTGDNYQIAAMTLSSPLFFFTMALSNLFGVGGASVIPRLLGQKKIHEAKFVSCFCFYGVLALSLVLTAFLLFFQEPVLKLMGTSPQTYKFAKDYYIVTVCGTFAMMGSMVLVQLLRSEGAAKEAMFSMVFGTVLNIILDPIMITGFGWGCFGAALASVLGSLSSLIFALICFRSKKSVLSISLHYFMLNKNIAKNVFEMGIPSCFQTMLSAVANLAAVKLTSSFGDVQIALLGITRRLMSVPVLLLIGFTQGVQPLLGYTYAAGLRKRMNKAIRFTLKTGLIFGSLCCLFFMLYAPTLVGCFIQDEEAIKLGAFYVRLIVFPFPIMILQFTCGVFFQAVGKAFPAFIVSICRQGLLYMPCLFVLGKMFGMSGVIVSTPISDLFTLLVSGLLFVHIRRNLKRQSLNLIEKKPQP